MEQLYGHYEGIIAEMPEQFTSHEFILRLAQQHQGEYIQALNHYRAATAPFRTVHGILAERLHQHPTLVRKIGMVTDDPDIFRNPAPCAIWGRA
jgi:hypothetical protein